MNNNFIFLLQKLDGTKFKLPIACKMIKLFRRRNDHGLDGESMVIEKKDENVFYDDGIHEDL